MGEPARARSPTGRGSRRSSPSPRAPALARPGDGGAVRLRRRADLQRARAEPRRHRRLRRPRAAGQRLQPPLPGADRARLRARSTASPTRTRRRRRRTRVVMSLAAVPAYLLARRVAGGGSRCSALRSRWPCPSIAYTGDDHDREPLLPGRARRSPACSCATSSARVRGGSPRSSSRSPSRSRRARSRSPSSPAIATAPLAAGAVPLAPGRRSARSCRSTSSARPRALGLVVAAARARPVARRPARRLQHRGRGRLRRRRTSCASGSGTSRSSTSTSGSSPSPSLLVLVAARSHGLPARLQEHVAATLALARLVDARRRRVRLSLRVRPRPGPLPLLPRAAPRRVRARVGRARRAASPRGDRSRRRRRARARARLPVRAVHRRAGEVGHARADPAVDVQRAPRSRAATGRPSPSSARCSLALFLLVPRAVRRRGPARPARALRGPLAARLVGAARLLAAGDRGAVPGHPAASSATGSTAPSRTGTRSPCSGRAAPTASRST